jgi:hypothetical protein
MLYCKLYEKKKKINILYIILICFKKKNFLYFLNFFQKKTYGEIFIKKKYNFFFFNRKLTIKKKLFF